MTLQLSALCFDAVGPTGLGRFWAGLLGWDVDVTAPDDVRVAPASPGGFPLRFRPTSAVKTSKNRIHLDLTSASPAEQQEMVERALALGGRHVDVGQRGDEGHVVLGDLEGNEFCVIEAGNGFLAGCGRVGAINCDGTQALGYFWSAALDWPLVWDQDEETAIQSPLGGSKITWSGPPLMPRDGKDRLQLEVAVPPGSDVDAEVRRLIGLGATPYAGRDGGADVGPNAEHELTLLDPDGNWFAVVRGAATPRSS